MIRLFNLKLNPAKSNGSEVNKDGNHGLNLGWCCKQQRKLTLPVFSPHGCLTNQMVHPRGLPVNDVNHRVPIFIPKLRTILFITKYMSPPGERQRNDLRDLEEIPHFCVFHHSCN